MEKISNQFKQKLNKLKDKTLISVLISSRIPETKLERRLTAEEKSRVSFEIAKTTIPITNYLSERNIIYSAHCAGLGVILANLNKKQLYDIVKEDYVAYVLENQRVYSIG